jgi:hypothetical protein
MPRLSLYRPNRTRDYQFLDRRISEMYTVGGIDIFIHKFLGPKATTPDGSSEDISTLTNADATLPAYSQSSPLFIEDLLLLENRDRAYDPDVYVMRGVYKHQDIDFDLTQFGLFLNNDTLFITFHYNNMIDTFGRKLMNGDVLEVPNLKDYHPLNSAIPEPLPRYYVIQDANFASEGFSQTWYPHLWRIKATPLVNAQEFQEVLKKPMVKDTAWDPGNYYPYGSIVNQGGSYYIAIKNTPADIDINNTEYWKPYTPLTEADLMTTRPKDLEINDAILVQAEADVPKSGYDTVKFYILPTNPDGAPADPTQYTADYTFSDASRTISDTQDQLTPTGDGYTTGYLTGDGIAPNGLPVIPGVSFPQGVPLGTYCLRLDYYPHRLFRFDGARWAKIEDVVRTQLTPGPENETLRSSFVNNTKQVNTNDRGPIPSRQSLSQALKPKADNGG